MLRGEEGRQARELDELVIWVKQQAKPDIVCLSNALLIGLARRLGSEFKCPVVCMLQGEDTFLDMLPEPYSRECWQTLAERSRDVALFGAASRYFGELMSTRLSSSPPEKVKTVYNGINLEGYSAAEGANAACLQMIRQFSATLPACAGKRDWIY